MIVDPIGRSRPAFPAGGAGCAGRCWLRHRPCGVARDGLPGCAGAGSSRRTGDLGRLCKPGDVRAPGTRRSGRRLDIRAGAGRRPDMAGARANSSAAAHGGRICGCRSGALLGRARRSADVWDTRRNHAPGAARLDSGGRVSARAALEPRGPSSLSLRRRYVGRAAGSTVRPRFGVRRGAAWRLCLDIPRPRGGDGAAAARLPIGHSYKCPTPSNVRCADLYFHAWRRHLAVCRTNRAPFLGHPRLIDGHLLGLVGFAPEFVERCAAEHLQTRIHAVLRARVRGAHAWRSRVALTPDAGRGSP